MIIIHATLQINPAKQEEFLKEVQTLIAASRAEGGNLSYSLKKDMEQENTYTMVEVWQDRQAVASHNASEHFIAFSAKAKEFLSAPLEVQSFEGERLG